MVFAWIFFVVYLWALTWARSSFVAAPGRAFHNSLQTTKRVQIRAYIFDVS